jgi:hypothetical protein
VESLREEIKQLIKAINVMNKILLSSQLGENLRNIPIDRAKKVSEQYEKLLKELK